MTTTLDAHQSHQSEQQQLQYTHEAEQASTNESEPSAGPQSGQTQAHGAETSPAQTTDSPLTHEPLQPTPPVPPHDNTPSAAASRHAPAAQTNRGAKRPYTPVPQHIADAAAVLVFDCGYAIPDAVRIVKMPRGGLTKRLQRLCARRDGRAPVPKRVRKSSSAVESHLSVATSTPTAASSSVLPHIEDAACVLLFDCGYSLEIVLEIMKVPWSGLAQRLEHLLAHPDERQSFRARPDTSDTIVAAAPAVTLSQPSVSHQRPAPLARAAQDVSVPPLSPVPSQGPESALIDLLVFPDTALPCQRYHWGIGCSRVNCAWVHDQGSSLLELLKLIRGAATSIDLCVSQITCPEIVHAIRSAQTRGIDVRVIVDYDLSLDKASKVEQFAQKSIPVRYGDKRTPLRHNFCIIDGKTLLTGSFNWGLDGVLIHASELAIHTRGRLLVRFASLFGRIWAKDGA